MAEIWATEALHTCFSNVCLWWAANKRKVGLKTGWPLRGGAKAACFKLRHSYGGPVQDLSTVFESDSGRWYGTDTVQAQEGLKKASFLLTAQLVDDGLHHRGSVKSGQQRDLISSHNIPLWLIGPELAPVHISCWSQTPSKFQFKDTFLHLVAYLGCFKFSDVNFRLQQNCMKRKCGT